MRGYFGIGVYNPKTEINIGTLWRSAKIFGASFIFTIGKRYKKQASDTLKTPLHVPLFEYENFDNFKSGLPHSCQLIGVELTDKAIDCFDFKHPERACYLLGAEDHGLSDKILAECQSVVKIYGQFSLNVAVAGSVVMYDRLLKGQKT